MEPYLVFSIDGIQCAVPLAVTVRVIRMVRPAVSARDRPWEAGTINVHGTTMPVISMRAVFGRTVIPPRLSDKLIIAETENGEVALWVESTSGVLEISFSEESIPAQGPAAELLGVLQVPEGIFAIRDLGLLLGQRASGSAEVSEVLQSSSNTSEDILLEDRAKKIAQPETEGSEHAVVEVLKFRLAYREYAIEMKYIREVILTGEITPVPGTPEYISGICIVRGEIISLVDLRALLSIPEKGLTDLNRVIVMTDQGLSFGILADQITGIGLLEFSRISASVPGGGYGKSPYIRGIADNALTVLDAHAIFSDPKMIIEDA